MARMKVKIWVAIYVRVSTTEQAQEGYSLDAQERLLTDYCKAHGYERKRCNTPSRDAGTSLGRFRREI